MKEFKELSLESVKHIQRERKRKESNGLMQLQRQKVLKSVSFFDTSEFQKGAVFYENPKNTSFRERSPEKEIHLGSGIQVRTQMTSKERVKLAEDTY